MLEKLNNNQQTFFALLRAGLWEKDVELQKYGTIDFSKVYRLAEEQSLVGLTAAGLEHIIDVKTPQKFALQFAGTAMQMEQRNMAMNVFLASLSEKLKAEHINALLVKGQGIAQCYERPHWRACGDVDFLLDNENYEKGKRFLSGIAQEVHEENDFDMHFSVMLDGWDVELHGSMRSMLPTKTDFLIDKVQKEAFEQNKHRIWNNNGTKILLPSPDDDVIFVFTHILKHFFHYGIGLRQVCDWCRLIFTYRDSLNYGLLESRLRKMGLMSEWKVLGALAVEYLGYPKDSMPFLESSSVQEFKKFKRKADRVLAYILETGNFGHNRDNSYYNNTNAIVRGMMSLWRHTCDSFKHSFIFPVDSVRIWGRMFGLGICDALKGK